MSQTCPSCRKPLPADAPAGLCPQCLLAGVMTGDSNRTSDFAPFEPPTVAELSASFPQLEIIELIGAGGMGAVYKARQLGLDRLVALKILPPRDDLAFAERFTREARTLAKLNHPGIVGVYDFGQAGGLYYFVMEYVEGVNLRQATRAGKLSPTEALAIVPQICEALQFAHDANVVHRDIKPENILLDAKGRVKNADFGLAKMIGEPLVPRTLTHTHQVMGTIRYMAPEQWERPGEVDHRADIYSLGVVFYELLTGELPLGRFPLPSERAQVDLRLDEIVLRTLEKQPEKRYQQAREVKTDVERISIQQPSKTTSFDATVVVPPVESQIGVRRGRRPVMKLTALILMGCAVAIAALVYVEWQVQQRQLIGTWLEEADEHDENPTLYEFRSDGTCYVPYGLLGEPTVNSGEGGGALGLLGLSGGFGGGSYRWVSSPFSERKIEVKMPQYQTRQIGVNFTPGGLTLIGEDGTYSRLKRSSKK